MTYDYKLEYMMRLRLKLHLAKEQRAFLDKQISNLEDEIQWNQAGNADFWLAQSEECPHGSDDACKQCYVAAVADADGIDDSMELKGGPWGKPE